GRQPQDRVSGCAGGGRRDQGEISAVGRPVDIEPVLIVGIIRPGQINLVGADRRGRQTTRSRRSRGRVGSSNHRGTGGIRWVGGAVGIVASDLEVVGRPRRTAVPRVSGYALVRGSKPAPVDLVGGPVEPESSRQVRAN